MVADLPSSQVLEIMATMSEIDQFWAGASPAGRARYTNIKLIGAGAYSVVARAEEVETGQRVAIKRIGEVFYDALEAKKVLREIRLLRDFHHKNIIGDCNVTPPPSFLISAHKLLCAHVSTNDTPSPPPSFPPLASTLSTHLPR